MLFDTTTTTTTTAGKFMIKTQSGTEYKFLRRIMLQYYMVCLQWQQIQRLCTQGHHVHLFLTRASNSPALGHSL